jgi:hypothetical protein
MILDALPFRNGARRGPQENGQAKQQGRGAPNAQRPFAQAVQVMGTLSGTSVAYASKRPAAVPGDAMHSQEYELTDCCDCGATISRTIDRAFALNETEFLCFGCAVRQGGMDGPAERGGHAGRAAGPRTTVVAPRLETVRCRNEACACTVPKERSARGDPHCSPYSLRPP